ncbi:MAG: nucleotide exchange factor GrpE [Gammaproteobacteria bacterium]|jgi:molecular chaperone GrpE|nr:nucleotide exchange factor GrpE [Gammaproteobacteria bacterium]
MADDKEPRTEGPQDTGASGDTAREASRDGVSGDVETSPEALLEKLEKLEQRAEHYRDQALRSQAEAENTRRRASRDVENAHKFALEKFAADLLPVLDSLEKAVEVASTSEGAESIAEGVELSLKLFLSVLEKHGIERIDPTGEPFDPQVHEALTMVPSEHAEPNSVVEVMQRGYLLNGRVVRAAKVVVARAPDSQPQSGG